MVSSKINNDVNYAENRSIDPEDKGLKTIMYEIELLDIPIVIVLGNAKYTFSKKGILYYPFYVVSENKVKSQLGVFETAIDQTIKLIDEDGDVDIEKLGEPLLYSFVNKRYLSKSGTNPKKIQDALEMEQGKKAQEVSSPDKKQGTEEDDESETDDEDDARQLKVKSSKLSEEKKKSDALLTQGVFTINPDFILPRLLPEETEIEAKAENRKFKESTRNTWIENFTKNNNYAIIDNEGGGDCFFAALRDAYATIGYKTTVAKLRAALASELTDDVFQEYLTIYNQYEMVKSDIEKQLKEYQNTNKIYKKRASETDDKEKRKQILDDVAELKDLYDAKTKELAQVKRDQTDDVGFMKGVNTLEKYREYINSSHFWADEWALTKLEQILKAKIIVLSQYAYSNKSYDNVLNCGSNPNDAQKFEPEFYIMMSYTGNHYTLITYKKRTLFTFKELPYDIKILIVNKCLERNSGLYYSIQDFRNFKSKLGLDPDEGNPILAEEDDELEYRHGELYEKTAEFAFHSKSLDNAKPGKGSNESIDKSIIGSFMKLKSIKDWRRKLDDSWSEAPFSVDRLRWASVEHYVQASKFKKGFPTFYSQFSLDNPSDLSKDPELAKNVADLKKKSYKSHRPENIKVDVDYDLGRKLQERKTALRAKFTQNEDLKQMLLATHKALLKHVERRKPAEPDVPLMELRRELNIAL
jgi:predicted NAD-dependent protein-ADP-ribosyltransferase YbiA (DUF1768 family)